MFPRQVHPFDMERGASLRGSLNGFSLRAALGEVADGSLGDHSLQDATFDSKMHESTRGYGEYMRPPRREERGTD